MLEERDTSTQIAEPPQKSDEPPRKPPTSPLHNPANPHQLLNTRNSGGNKSEYANQDSFEDEIDVVEANIGRIIRSITLEDLRNQFPDDVTQTSSIKLLKRNDQLSELQTILRDGDTTRSDFVFYADRLIRMVIEAGLNQLPFEEKTVMTHSGAEFKGLAFHKGICGVSIVRSGEAMEKGLRECCRSIRIGKVLVNKDNDSGEPSVVYARFPTDIETRKVLVMYPLLRTGNTVAVTIDVLLEYGCEQSSIFILTLFATPRSVAMIFNRFPNIHLFTTELHEEAPIQFGGKYFGTEF